MTSAPRHPPGQQRTSTASLPAVFLRVHFTLSGSPTSALTHAAAASTLSAGLRSLAGESVPADAWSLVGVDPAACVAVYRVAARHEAAARAALTSVSALAGAAPVPATARVLAASPFLLGLASDPGGLDAGALLSD